MKNRGDFKQPAVHQMSRSRRRWRPGIAEGCRVRVCDPRGAAHGFGACGIPAEGSLGGEAVCQGHLRRMADGITYSSMSGKMLLS